MAGERLIYGGGGGTGHKSVKISDSSIFASPNSLNLGSRTMVSFGAVSGVKRSGSSFYGSYDQDEIADDYLDEYLNQQEKKRRLSVEQVQFLEKNFETENKLEPERKVQLANELGLKPRQIAIWFQNRRARWKTKQMETDYETLHASYESLKANYDKILKENERLKSEVVHFKHSGFHGEMGKSNLEACESEELLSNQVPPDIISENEESKSFAVALGNEEQSSGKSDVSDMDSPRFIDNGNGANSSALESGESSLVFELNLSNFLQWDREDTMNEGFVEPAYSFPKIDDACVLSPANSCYYGFPAEDHPFFSFWSN